jgi:protoporphyrinogen oxidase
MGPNSAPLPLAVVGGGISGIAAALDLARSGRFAVTLYEKDGELGGLCGSTVWRGISFDKFYHVILPADVGTIAFIEELGLGRDIAWRPSRSGFLGGGRLVPFASAGDFLRFPFLTPLQKLKLGLGILSVVRMKAPHVLEGRKAGEWLADVFGASVCQKFWNPLLRSKLGEAADRTPATFMWATIRRLYGARGKTSGRERMGSLRGGLAPLLQTAAVKLREAGVTVKTGVAVRRLVRGDGRWRCETTAGPASFDSVLVTTPLPEAVNLIGWNDNENGAVDSYRELLSRIEYLGVVCVVAVLRRSLSPYYVVNLLDPDVPFTGIIESTNVLGRENVGGYHLVYLPKYLTQNDPLLSQPDGPIETLFLSRLRIMFPGLTDGEILHVRTFRSKFAQPLPRSGPSVRGLGFRGPWPGLYLAGTAWIDDSTVNNNAALGVARAAAAEIIAGD